MVHITIYIVGVPNMLLLSWLKKLLSWFSCTVCGRFQQSILPKLLARKGISFFSFSINDLIRTFPTTNGCTKLCLSRLLYDPYLLCLIVSLCAYLFKKNVARCFKTKFRLGRRKNQEAVKNGFSFQKLKKYRFHCMQVWWYSLLNFLYKNVHC